MEPRESARRIVRDPDPLGEVHGIITCDSSMIELLRSMATVAPSDSAVLITGETGTGKELFARAAHGLSERKRGPLVTVGCASIPDEQMESELFGHVEGSFPGALRDREGKFAQADGGTLFLDEIGELSRRMQAKLLSVLHDGFYARVGSDERIRSNFRLISATHHHIGAMVRKARFRKDLFYRLNSVILPLPPLRARGDDIAILAQHYLREESKGLGDEIELDAETLGKIKAYAWPGNVRELVNFVRRLALFARETDRPTTRQILESCLDPVTSKQPNLATIVLNAEKEAIVNALVHSGGNKAAAARQLGISRSTINDKIRRLHIDPEADEKPQRRGRSAGI